MINNGRCFTFNFPLSRKNQSHIVSPKNMSSTFRKWETLIVFTFFLVVVVFVSVFVVFFVLVFVLLFFLLCSLDAISSKFSESSEEDDEAIEAMVEIDKFEDSLKQKEIIKPE